MTLEETHIGLNKRRLRFVGALYISLAVIVFFSLALVSTWMGETGAWILKIAGGLIALFLVFTGAGAVRQLNDKSAGLIINRDGILDKSTTIACGNISWKSIKELEARPDEGILLVMVRKPEEIVKQAKNSAIKQVLQQNNRLYKTPVVIESRYLECTFVELNEKMADALKRFAPKK